MGTFKDLVNDTDRYTTEHHRIRWYTVVYNTSDRDRLKRYVESHATDNWYVEVVSETGDHQVIGGIDRAIVRYGPVHGNYPSDVSRLFRQAGVHVISGPDSQGEPEHVPNGCRHVNCKKSK